MGNDVACARKGLDASRTSGSGANVLRAKSEWALIHAIGDSHCLFFSGQQPPAIIPNKWGPGIDGAQDRLLEFRTYHLGPVLAYNLCERETTTRGREKLLSLLDRAVIPGGSTLLLCFGEIDCRCHLLKQAQVQNRTLADVAVECVRRYFGFIDELRDRQCVPVVWGPVASQPDDWPLNADFPRFGTECERNLATGVFSAKCRMLCAAHKIPYVSLLDKLASRDFRTNRSMFYDACHVKSELLPAAIAALKAAGVPIADNSIPDP